MANILVLQHHPEEGLGSLAPLLAAAGFSIDLRALDAGDPVPEDPGNYAGLILMGGPMSVHDEAEHPWLQAEKRLIALAAEQQCPILGHCLGAQLITVALGGQVLPNPVGAELGWWPVSLTAAGCARWPNLPPSFPLFHWHGEHCAALPAGAELLATNAATAAQAFAIGSHILALQAHPEVTAQQVRQWTAAGTGELAGGGRYVQPAVEILGNVDAACAELAATAATLYRPWLEQVQRAKA
ncbi:MAG: type 1 glutamine amidotransferase [Candidatus Igneacidithiobacillus chanchocoensis]